MNVLLLAETAADSTLSFGPLFVKMLIVTFIILAAAFLVLKFGLPRLAALRRNRNSAIQILDYQALDNDKSVYILKIEDRRVAVGVTGHSVNKICDLNP